MSAELRVLIVEDSENDTLLLARELRRAGYQLSFHRVHSEAAMRTALADQTWDVVVSDYAIPGFGGLAALRLLQELEIDVPFMVVSGTIDEETAVAAMKAGADDFVLKDNLRRLAPAIARELRDAEIRREHRRLEEQLRRSHRLEIIGSLAGGIAHDLKNQLTPILLAADMLREELSNGDRTAMLDVLRASTNRAAGILDQLLSFARGMEGRREPLQLSSLVQELQEILSHSLPKSIRIETSLPSDLWHVAGDATQLWQVLLNLSVNARDAMPEGGVLTISAENVVLSRKDLLNENARPGRHVRIHVTDTGTGIPAAVLPRIFEPFVTTKERGAGTGLGLFTSANIVKSHHGMIHVSTELGCGTEFAIDLPAVTGQAVPPCDLAAADLPGGNGQRVLVVDDEAAVREVVCEMLKAYGYRTSPAGSVGEAVACCLGEAVDLVLLDPAMRDVKGALAVQELRKRGVLAPIVVYTAGVQEGKDLQSTDAGVVAVLEKPCTTEQILRTLRDVLTGKLPAGPDDAKPADH